MALKYKLPAVLVLVLISLSIIHFKNDIVLSNGDSYVLNSYLDIIHQPLKPLCRKLFLHQIWKSISQVDMIRFKGS